MNRREFLIQGSLGMAVLGVNPLMAPFKNTRMGIVVHSYGNRWNSKTESKRYPAFSNAMDLLRHSHEIGAGGIQVVVRNWATDFVKQVRDTRENLGLFIEGSVALPKKSEEVPAFDADIKAAREAGADIVRTVCLGGRRYETFHSLEEFNTFQTNAQNYLQWAEPVLKKYKVKLAVENHKDYRATELVKTIKKIDSEWVGVTLDFGNSIALIEDPMEVIKTLAPYAFTTHVKDMGVREYADGFYLSEVPLGKGILDLKEIVNLCKKYNPGIRFNLEMITRDPLEIPCLKPEYWSSFEQVSGAELAKVLHLVKQSAYPGSLPMISGLDPESKLEAEEKNIISCLEYSKTNLGLA